MTTCAIVFSFCLSHAENRTEATKPSGVGKLKQESAKLRSSQAISHQTNATARHVYHQRNIDLAELQRETFKEKLARIELREARRKEAEFRREEKLMISELIRVKSEEAKIQEKMTQDSKTLTLERKKDVHELFVLQSKITELLAELRREKADLDEEELQLKLALKSDSAKLEKETVLEASLSEKLGVRKAKIAKEVSEMEQKKSNERKKLEAIHEKEMRLSRQHAKLSDELVRKIEQVKQELSEGKDESKLIAQEKVEQERASHALKQEIAEKAHESEAARAREEHLIEELKHVETKIQGEMKELAIEKEKANAKLQVLHTKLALLAGETAKQSKLEGHDAERVKNMGAALKAGERENQNQLAGARKRIALLMRSLKKMKATISQTSRNLKDEARNSSKWLRGERALEVRTANKLSNERIILAKESEALRHTEEKKAKEEKAAHYQVVRSGNYLQHEKARIHRAVNLFNNLKATVAELSKKVKIEGTKAANKAADYRAKRESYKHEFKWLMNLKAKEASTVKAGQAKEVSLSRSIRRVEAKLKKNRKHATIQQRIDAERLAAEQEAYVRTSKIVHKLLIKDAQERGVVRKLLQLVRKQRIQMRRDVLMLQHEKAKAFGKLRKEKIENTHNTKRFLVAVASAKEKFEDEKKKGIQTEKQQKAWEGKKLRKEKAKEHHVAYEVKQEMTKIRKEVNNEKDVMQWQKKSLAAVMKRHELWEEKRGAAFRNGVAQWKQEIDNVKRQIRAAQKAISAGKVNFAKNIETEHRAEAQRAIVRRGVWDVISHLTRHMKRIKTQEARDHKQKGIEAENLRRKIVHAAKKLHNLKLMHAHMFRKHVKHVASEMKREKIKVLTLTRRLRMVKGQVAVEAAQIAKQKRHVRNGLIMGERLTLALGRQKRLEAFKNARLLRIRNEEAKKVKAADLKFEESAAALMKERAKIIGEMKHENVLEGHLSQKLASLKAQLVKENVAFARQKVVECRTEQEDVKKAIAALGSKDLARRNSEEKTEIKHEKAKLALAFSKFKIETAKLQLEIRKVQLEIHENKDKELKEKQKENELSKQLAAERKRDATEIAVMKREKAALLSYVRKHDAQVHGLNSVKAKLGWQHRSEKAKQTKYAMELKKTIAELVQEVNENAAVIQYLKKEKVKVATHKRIEAMLSKEGVEVPRLADMLHSEKIRLVDELESEKGEHGKIDAAHKKMLLQYLKSKETQLGKAKRDEQKHETKYAAASRLLSELAQERVRAARFKKKNTELMEKVKTEKKREKRVALELANLKATGMREVEKDEVKTAQAFHKLNDAHGRLQHEIKEAQNERSEMAQLSKNFKEEAVKVAHAVNLIAAKAIQADHVKLEKLANEARHSKHQLQSLRHTYKKEKANSRHEEVALEHVLRQHAKVLRETQ